MLPRKSVPLVLLTVLSVGSVGLLCHAQQAQPLTPVRYHLGDDARWSDPNLDDSSWSVAPDGRVPEPAADTNGFVWSRVRVAVPQNAMEPLAFRWSAVREGAEVEEVFVNGVRVGRTGDFPPHAAIRMVPQNLVIDLPAEVARAGTVAEVAIRTWTAPLGRGRRSTQVMDISIDRGPLQHLIAREAQAQDLLGYMPQFAIGLLLEVLGIAVLALGLWSGRKDLFLCALWLVTMPVFLALISLNSLVSVSACGCFSGPGAH